ncbi:MAG: protein phosphatase 2C domain-containing protein [Desulfuromonadaceae bacterium]|nr:protein phosphatase 2C domain-containing protein [Desulfuromonadaceae bacterium]
MHNFKSRFVLLNADSTTLPFTIGSVTQHGFHEPIGNNQDAVGLGIYESNIIAVVCDGCAGASPHGLNNVSFNECGSQLLTILATQAIQRLLSLGFTPGTDMIAKLELDLKEKYFQLVSLLVGKDSFLREHVLFELLMSTIVGAVIGPERWCVFHGGDGVVIVNGKYHDINGSPPDGHSGEYLANSILLKERGNQPDNVLHILNEGDSSNLNNLLLGSDGMLDLMNSKSNLLENLAYTLDKRSPQYQTGYDSLFFREFRKRVWNPLSSGTTLNGEHDDRSLILIRRLPWLDIKPSNQIMESPLGAATPTNDNEQIIVDPISAVSIAVTTLHVQNGIDTPTAQFNEEAKSDITESKEHDLSEASLGKIHLDESNTIDQVNSNSVTQEDERTDRNNEHINLYDHDSVRSSELSGEVAHRTVVENLPANSVNHPIVICDQIHFESISPSLDNTEKFHQESPPLDNYVPCDEALLTPDINDLHVTGNNKDMRTTVDHQGKLLLGQTIQKDNPSGGRK